jgi:hypothetical protein
VARSGLVTGRLAHRGPRPGTEVGVPFLGDMSDATHGCPRCEGLVVMVAVACTECGEFHRSGYDARSDGGGAPSSSEPRTVWDVPALPADASTRADPASAFLPEPVRPDVMRRSASPHMRTSATFTNGSSTNSSARSQPRPKALSPGRPAPAPAPSAPAPPDPPRVVDTEPPRPRRPLVQVIQEVLNRSVTRDLEPGTCVIVRNQFNGRWTPGFAVHEAIDAGYRIRRSHNGVVLPTVFVRSDVAADGWGRGVGAKLPDAAAACASI